MDSEKAPSTPARVIPYRPATRSKRRLSRRLGISVVGALPIALYFVTYFGWVRRCEGPGMYSLNYDRVPTSVLRRALERLHIPLRSFDARHYVRVTVYDTSGPHNFPDFDEAPDFTLDSR